MKSPVLCAAGICGLEPPFAVYAEQVCDSAKVSDHHALVPTMSTADCELEDLPAGECELLRLMAAQVLRAVSAPHRWLETSPLLSWQVLLSCSLFHRRSCGLRY